MATARLALMALLLAAPSALGFTAAPLVGRRSRMQRFVSLANSEAG
eukprot:CAMPEP_0118870588 /NCGR_PEP_ID=MMETSP1163-20130328/13497_1 /TAXON_ID=124430 /ORGANISM="Phaeomonas parva, Strain CCMP2877" /LENGTH=45 /DNA_ID= /DNA_START= /DNA_END= /DNA_ORIENTATION=